MTLEKPLGLVLEQVEDRVIVTGLQAGNAAQSGMVQLGDQIVAVGDVRVTADAIPPEAVAKASYMDWAVQFIGQQPKKDCRITVKRADGVGVALEVEPKQGGQPLQIPGLAPGIGLQTYLEANPGLEGTGIAFMCGSSSCGTCACDVLEGADLLSTADDGEEDTLYRIGAGADARLMCNASVVAVKGTVRIKPMERE
jgi:ferredoxin